MGLFNNKIWNLKLIDARLYLISFMVGVLTGLITVPYHYLLTLFFNIRLAFFQASHPWFIHVMVFLGLWGVLLLVALLLKYYPLIMGGGISQTRGAINGRIVYKHSFQQLMAKFTGGLLSVGSGLSMGREGPSVQIGSYIGDLVGKWGHVLSGERKQLLLAGASAGLSSAFIAPLAGATMVIESIERFDAPKTAIASLLAGVTAGAVANIIYPLDLYKHITVSPLDLSVLMQIKFYVVFTLIVSLFGKFYSIMMLNIKRLYPMLKLPLALKLFNLMLMTYVISMFVTELTGGGEQFLLQQCNGGSDSIWWLTGMLLLHMFFTCASFSSGLPGGSFIPTLVTGALLGKIVGLIMVNLGYIEPDNISFIMLLGMSAFLVAVVRTPITSIILITEITGHFEVFYPSIVLAGLTFYLTEMLNIIPFNVMFYNEMINKPYFQNEKRIRLDLEVMTGSYFDGKTLQTLQLPSSCVLVGIKRDWHQIDLNNVTIMPADQITIELDSKDIEKLYDPLISMANIY